MIKKIVTGLGINTSNPSELLNSLVKSTYKINLEVETTIRNVIVGIIRDQLAKKLTRQEILQLYNKFGVLSTFSARILNVILPDLTDSERDEVMNATDRIINDPDRGLKVILRRGGRAKYPLLAKAVDDEEKIKEVFLSGEGIDVEE